MSAMDNTLITDFTEGNITGKLYRFAFPLFLSSLLQVVYNMVSAVMRGMGDSKNPFVFVALASVINIILDIIFVAYMKMGAAYAAYATVISQAISFILCGAFILKVTGKRVQSESAGGIK